jgi:UPF0271 protein
VRAILNVDAGEMPSEPEELYSLAGALNVACGGHAGDEASMARVLAACARTGARAGAHPSYEDEEGFGRKSVHVDPSALEAQIERQCARLRAVGEALGVPIAHAKLHGALYHDASRDRALAEACVRGIRRALGEVAIVGPAGSAMEAAARAAGLRFEREAFADRAMRPDGSLVPRSEAGAMIEDPARAAAQARELARRGDVDTICVHGDTAGAIAIARAVRRALEST